LSLVTRLLITLSWLALLGLSGCSDASSSTAHPSDPTPTVSTGTAEPSPTPQAETPEEFVRRWVEVDRVMENSGKTDEYRQMSRRCRACAGLASQIEEIYATGGYVKTAGWTILSIKVSRPGRTGAVTAHMKINAAPTEYVEAAGAPVQRLEGGVQEQLVTLSSHDGVWNVDDVEQVAT
jgi:hypothetical protein